MPINVVIQWEPATQSILGTPVDMAGYEVIVKKLTPDHPCGFSRVSYDVHVLPAVTTLSVPDEFWEPNNPHEFEVLALEESDNQTIAAGFFRTE